jgi:isopentenyl diphosphate isomerase/L-lactate dehydrogenase-like FMN-dependent dehydrogenase
MALDADAVALGRLTAYARSVGGEQELVRALDLLLEETHVAMGLIPTRTWTELTPDDVLVVPAPYRYSWAILQTSSAANRRDDEHPLW